MRASSPARAESRITGIARLSGCSRIAAIRPKPSRPGIMTSETTRSGGRARMLASAASPSGTASTS